MNDSARPQLKLIEGGREALEYRLLRLCLYGTPEEFRTAIDALMPRGELKLVKLRAPE